MEKHILILIVLLALLLFYFYAKSRSIGGFEGFTTYKRNPNAFYETGSDPLTFYEYPIYREPYMYPQQFYSSYPVPYLTYYPDTL